jgi:hypothetical protein
MQESMSACYEPHEALKRFRSRIDFPASDKPRKQLPYNTLFLCHDWCLSQRHGRSIEVRAKMVTMTAHRQLNALGFA